MRLAIFRAKHKLRLKRTQRRGNVIGCYIAYVGIIPRHYGPQAVFVDLILGPLQPLLAQTVIVNPLLVIDG
jgi:hypothetical protein